MLCCQNCFSLINTCVKTFVNLNFSIPIVILSGSSDKYYDVGFDAKESIFPVAILDNLITVQPKSS